MQLATLCYIRKNNQTLMMLRNKKDRDIHIGKWNGLGGKLEPGESPHEGVIREVREESGLEISQPAARGVMTYPKFKDDEDWYVFLYTADEFSGEPLKECDEGTLEWIPDEKLFDLTLWEGDYLFLRWLLDGRHFGAKFIYQDKKLIDHQVVFYS